MFESENNVLEREREREKERKKEKAIGERRRQEFLLEQEADGKEKLFSVQRSLLLPFYFPKTLLKKY